MRSDQHRKEAEVGLARETRGCELLGIPSPKGERVRTSWIPTTSLLSELRTSATQTDDIRGFETKLSENEGPLKTAFAENQTTLIENRPITSGRDHITENGK